MCSIASPGRFVTSLSDACLNSCVKSGSRITRFAVNASSWSYHSIVRSDSKNDDDDDDAVRDAARSSFGRRSRDGDHPSTDTDAVRPSPSAPGADAGRADPPAMPLMRPLAAAASAAAGAVVTATESCRLGKSRSETQISGGAAATSTRQQLRTATDSTNATSECRRLTLSKSTTDWTALYEQPQGGFTAAAKLN